MQCMAIEFGRHLYKDETANSSEFNHSTKYPIINLMLEQRNITDMGGTMRLGLYPCKLQPGTKAALAYQVDQVDERHRHRFEFNNAYRDKLEAAGMSYSGLSPDGRLGAGRNGNIWEIESGRKLASVSADYVYRSVEFSPDGGTMAAWP